MMYLIIHLTNKREQVILLNTLVFLENVTIKSYILVYFSFKI
ncbi:unnamed protein product [Arabidopsis halleri]